MDSVQELWMQLPDETKLLVMMVLSGFMIYRSTKAEGIMVVPLLMAGFAAMAYVLMLAMGMV